MTPLQPSDQPYDGPNALAAVKREESRFEKVWADLQAKVRRAAAASARGLQAGNHGVRGGRATGSTSVVGPAHTSAAATAPCMVCECVPRPPPTHTHTHTRTHAHTHTHPHTHTHTHTHTTHTHTHTCTRAHTHTHMHTRTPSLATTSCSSGCGPSGSRRTPWSRRARRSPTRSGTGGQRRRGSAGASGSQREPREGTDARPQGRSFHACGATLTPLAGNAFTPPTHTVNNQRRPSPRPFSTQTRYETSDNPMVHKVEVRGASPGRARRSGPRLAKASGWLSRQGATTLPTARSH